MCCALINVDMNYGDLLRDHGSDRINKTFCCIDFTAFGTHLNTRHITTDLFIQFLMDLLIQVLMDLLIAAHS